MIFRDLCGFVTGIFLSIFGAALAGVTYNGSKDEIKTKIEGTWMEGAAEAISRPIYQPPPRGNQVVI